MRKIINGDVNLSKLHLTELFDLSDVEVTGDFYCVSNNLTSLEGAPHTVGGSFFCNSNNLTSLKGAPHTVGESFSCYNTNLTSLKGAPQTVGGDFDCGKNNLTNLEGSPHTVGGFFYISYSLKDKFPEEYIRSLSKIRGNVFYY